MKLSFILLMSVFMTVNVFATSAGYFMPTDTIRDPSDYLAYENNSPNNSAQEQEILRVFDPNDIPYLIITTNYLKDYFTPLKNWKTRKGVRTEIITKEAISTSTTLNGNYPDTYMQIKYCIYYYFTNFHTQYVLLGGDNEAIPQVACWGKYEPNLADDYCLKNGVGCNIYNSSSHTCNTPIHHNAQAIPADIFYSCIDIENLAWNYNSNSMIGETDDGPNGSNIDLTPDVYVGRIPIAQIDTERAWLTNWIEKVIAYEKTPPLNDNYAQKLLLCGGKYDYWHDGDDGDGEYSTTPHSDVAHWSEDMFNQFIARYCGTFQRDHLFDCFDTNLTGFTDPLNFVPEYRMTNVLNRNYNLVFEASHATAAGWQIYNNGSYAMYFSDHVDALSNDVRLGVIYSWGCTSAAWDLDVGSPYPDHRVGIAKEFLVKPTGGGAVSYIGYTRYGIRALNDHDSYIGFDYAGHFYAELLNHDSNDAEYPPKLGRAFAKAKANFKNNSDSLGLYRWGQFGLNLVGDPELNVYTTTPTLYSTVAGFNAPSSFVLGQTNTFTLNTGDVCSKACLYNDNGVFLVQEADSSTGIITFSFTPVNTTSVMLTITGNNRAPFLATIPVYQRCITGTIALSESPSLVANVNVDLINDTTNNVIQSIHPDSNGAYLFEVPFGTYKVKYSLFYSGLLFYTYTSNQLIMDDSTPQLHITLPLINLHSLLPGDISVKKNNSFGESFNSIGDA
jgi:hypothetical protein